MCWYLHATACPSAVDTAYNRCHPADDPEWTYRPNEDEIVIMAGYCHVDLNQPDRAHPLLTGVLERYDDRQARESALYHVVPRRGAGTLNTRRARRAHP